MIHNTFNISFYCRNSKKDKDGLAPIELVIVINGERTNINLPRKERPETFKAALASRRNSDIKDYISAVRKRLNEITTDMMDKGIMLTSSTLKDYFQHGGVRYYTIGELFDEYISIVEKKSRNRNHKEDISQI